MPRRILVVAAALLSTVAASAAEFQLLPNRFTLSGPEAQQRVIAVRTAPAAAESLSSSDEPVAGPLITEGMELESSDPSVAVVAAGVVRPVGNGQAEIIARAADGSESRAQVTVENADAPHAWSFRHDVQPILAKLGCNAGACHGALAGKGGFRLSLHGYDPLADYQSITREALGRRIEPGDPGRSLLLAKPTGALPHKGGLRLELDSRDYQILSRWIANGAAPPSQDDPSLERISLLPSETMLAEGQAAQVLVQAHYSDGRVADVTHWAKFTATDESIVGVDPSGRVEVRGSGQGAVLVWFSSKVALARFTVPYPYQVAEEVYRDAPQRNFIDELVLRQLQTLNLQPSPRCSDETFIRRASIDTIGRLPTLTETQDFLADARSDKRDRLIEALLSSEDFVDYWSYKWSDLLLVNGTRLRPAGVKAFYSWIREQVSDNVPWDEFVRSILTARGSSVENGATNFYALHQDPESMTENASQAFLGLSIGCAKCHNHPLEKWTNDQYYAMANMFARVRGKGWGGDSRNGDGIRTLYVATSGDLIQPARGKPQPPAALDQPPLEIEDPGDRREALADWMVAADNPYFTRAITNRIWKNFYGVALIEEPDDLRLSNPASNEPLLAAASEFLVDSDFDLKRLIREILRSETYQRSSQPLPHNEAESRYYSRYYPRRMMAEVLLDAIDQTLQTSTRFETLAFPGADRVPTDFYPTGTRAIELYDSAVESYFLQTFGRNPREITCECERSDEPSMVQVLHMSNGETLNPKLAAQGNRITRWLAAEQSDREIVDALFLAALARHPTEDERQQLLAVISEYGPDARRQAIEDLCWGVLTSAEFVFNQ
ncbi:DUF1549 domain-containing protein [Candidatus Laterigemmans baculatus]|uniref:DUF1549 domain-containing protein n=1 Tax=Candidatus Laterigemmans baculatus TaxID=2770505 RepID=UPI0013DC782D|nr:DUF1549 domain-containing protein [Candidatus Laterigemmans baculatus]